MGWGELDYSYLVEYFRIAWFDSSQAGEIPVTIWWFSCILFVLAFFPAIIAIRKLIGYYSSVTDSRANIPPGAA